MFTSIVCRARTSQSLLFQAFLLILVLILGHSSPAYADSAPPELDNGTAHFEPVPWPTEPADPRDCQDADSCGDWIPYTLGGETLNDQRVQDPSHGGARPQNYVNISSSCTDQALPSVYYAYDSAKEVLFFRWRVEQIGNTYGTGPKSGSYSNVDPWNSALWTVFFDVDGDGYRDLAAHLDGQSGLPFSPIDHLFGIWGDIPTQSIDHEDDPNIHVLAHNPTAFTDLDSGHILNFQNSNTPTVSWPNGSAETTWDYGTTRSRLITQKNVDGATCDEYFIDYQIPLDMLDASSLGGPSIASTTPFSMLFCTANSLNDPMQKDCLYNGDFITDPNRPAPFGDVITPDGGAVQEPLVDSVSAASCGPATVTAEVQDAIKMVDGVTQTTVDSVAFSYYFDANGNGEADDGGSWTQISGTSTAQDLKTWTASWDSTGLQKGQYLISAQATDEDGNQSPAPGLHSATMVNTCGAPPPSISKSVSPVRTTVGEIVPFTVTVDNSTGAVDLPLTTITDSLPGGFSYVETTNDGTLNPTESPANGETDSISWKFGSVSVARGESATLVFKAQTPLDVGTYNNVVSAETSVGTLTSDPVQIGVGAPKLSIAKGASTTSVAPTDIVTYTIRYANDSPVDVSSVVISDVLPSGLTFDSALDGGIYSGGTITWDVGDIASGDGPHEVRFTATVADPYPDAAAIPLINSATIDSPDTDPASASAAIHVDAPRPMLILQKEANTALISPGSLVTFTLRYANTGSGFATNVVITDSLPAGFTFESAMGTVTSDPGAGGKGNVVWSIGNVAAGASGSVQLTLRADTPFEEANLATNAASIDSDQTEPLSDTYDVGVIQTGQACSVYYFHDETADVGADNPQRIANPTAPTGNGTVISKLSSGSTYVEMARFYQDPATSSDVEFSGTISTTVYIDRSPGQGVDVRGTVYTFDPTTGITSTLGSGAKTYNGNSSGAFQFDVAAEGTLRKSHRLLWIFEFSGAEAGIAFGGQVNSLFNAGDTFTANAHADFCVTPPAELYLDKTVSDLAVQAGDTLTYTINFGNTGQSNATGAVITDTLPNGVTFQSATLNGSPITPSTSAGQVRSFVIQSSGTITDGVINGGQSGTLQVVARVDEPLGDGITELLNTAQMESDQTVLISDTATSKIAKSALFTEKRASPTLLAAGDVVTYTVTVGNSGTGEAEGIVISDTLPATDYFNYVTNSARLDGAQIDSEPVGGSLLHADVESLLPGESATLTYQMQVAPSGVPSGITELDNTATVTDTGGSVATSDPVTVSISSNPNLRISKSLTPSDVRSSGELLTYTITIRNTGSSDALDVLVRDPIPNNTRYVNGSMVYTGNEQTDSQDGDVGHFDSASNRVRFVVGTLSSGAQRSMQFTVRVDDTLPNGVTAIPNTATVSASNSTAKTASADTEADAAPVLTVDKAGPDTVAYPLTTLSADVSNNSVLQVDDTALLKQNQYLLIGTDTVRISAIGANTVTVDSEVTASSGDELIGALTYSIRYENSGDAPATNVTLTDVLPVGSTFVAATDSGSSSGGTVVTWNLGLLDPGEGGRVQVTLFPDEPGTLTNTATLDSDETAPVDDSVVTEVGGLRVTKRTLTPEVTQTDHGTTAIYVMQIENTRAAPANGALVTDTLGAGFTYSQTLGISGYDNNAPEVTPVPGDSDPTWGTFVIPADGRVLITYTVAISSTQGAATYQDFATATSTDSPVVSYDALTLPDEDVTVRLVYEPSPVTKRDALAVDQNSDGNVNPGDTIEYTVVFTNTNDATITGVVFTDTLDSNTALVVGSVTASRGTIVSGNASGDNSIRVDIGALGSGADVIVTFRATVDGSLPDGVLGVSNQGTVTSNELDSMLSDDPDTNEEGDATVTPITTEDSHSTITGDVYHDLNGNGVFDDGEEGMVGVLIALSNGDTTTTNSDGNYSFSVLPGTYTITEINPTGYESSGDSSGANDDTIPDVTATAGQTSSGHVFFDAQPVTVAGRVLEDANANGTVDSGETGISGVTVMLNNGDTVTTDGDGDYSFSVLPGSYSVAESNPSSYTSSAAIAGTVGSTGTDVDTIAVTLTSGKSSTGNNFLDYRQATLSGHVYNDRNGNGSLDEGEEGISGVTVDLLQNSGVLSTATTGDGSVSFTGLTPGSYTIRETDLDGYVSTTDNEVAVSLASGESGSISFGDRQIGTISGVVFNDGNGNGIRNTGETGIPSVTIALSDGAGSTQTSITGSDGGYSFSDLATGTYTVTETDPAGYVSTTSNTVPVTLTAHGAAIANFGDRQLGSISGVVFHDSNGNGRQDDRESGMRSVTVALLDADGSSVDNTSSAADGSYVFANVVPDSYTVQIEPPVNHSLTTDNPVPIAIAPGETTEADFGLQPPAAQPILVSSKRDYLAGDVDDDGTAGSGDVISYTVVITNVGGAEATGVVFRDTLDPNTSLVAGSVQSSQGNPSIDNNRFMVSLGTLRAGDVGEITFTARVNDLLSAGGRQIRNQGLVLSNELPTISTDDPDTTKHGDPTLTPIQRAPWIEVLKEVTQVVDGDDDSLPGPGDTLEYQLTVVNHGNLAATGVSLNDVPDRNTQIVVGSVQSSQGSIQRGNHQADAGIVVRLGEIAGGRSATIRYRVTISDLLPAGVTRVANQALVSADNFPVTPSDDPNTFEANDPTVTQVAPHPWLVATKRDSLAVDADDNGIPSPGDTLVYQVTIQNQGNAAATGIVYQDRPDRNTRLTVGSVQSGRGSVTRGNIQGDKRIAVDIGTLAANGGSITISYRVTINSPVPDDVTHIINQGLVSSNELPTLSTNDPDTVSAGDATKTPLVAGASLVGTKTDSLFDDKDSNGFASPGDTLIYYVKLSNEGTVSALDVSFTDSPDSNTQLVAGSVQTSQGTITSGNGKEETTLAIDVGDVSPGDAVTISYRVTINDPLPSGVELVANQATFAGSNIGQGWTSDPVTPIVGDVTGTRIGQSTYIEAYKEDVHFDDKAETGDVTPDDILLYQITLDNLGSEPSTNVLFQDEPDRNTALIAGSVRTSLGIIVSGNNTGDEDIIVEVGTIPAGDQATISFLVSVHGALPAKIEAVMNQGEASSDTQPSVPTDDPSTPEKDDPTSTGLTLGITYLYLPTVAGTPDQDPTVPLPAPEPTPPPSEPPIVSNAPCPAVGCSVPGLAHPKAIAHHVGYNAFYLTSRDNDQLFKVDVRTNEVLATVPTGAAPWDVLVDESRNRVYVSNYTSGDVWIYDAESLDLIAQIPVGPQAALMDFLPGLDTVAVVVRGLNGVAFVHQMQPTSLIGTTGAGAFGIAALPEHERFVVLNRDTGNGRILYRRDGSWHNDGAELRFGQRGERVVPFGAVYHPMTNKLYVQYTGSNGRWFVDVFQIPDGAPFRVDKIATVEVGSSGSNRDPNVGGIGLGVNANTQHLFITNNTDNSISVLDSVTDTVVATLVTGVDPFTIAVDSHADLIYVVLRNVNRFQKIFLNEEGIGPESGQIYLPEVSR